MGLGVKTLSIGNITDLSVLELLHGIDSEELFYFICMDVYFPEDIPSTGVDHNILRILVEATGFVAGAHLKE